MATLFISSETIHQFPECVVHKHVSGQYSIVFENKYRFLLPECRTFDDVVEYLDFIKKAFEKGFVLTGNVGDNGETLLCF